jgi:hypothetical protein
VPFWSKIAESHAVCGTSGCGQPLKTQIVGEDTYDSLTEITTSALSYTQCAKALINQYIHMHKYTFTHIYTHGRPTRPTTSALPYTQCANVLINQYMHMYAYPYAHTWQTDKGDDLCAVVHAVRKRTDQSTYAHACIHVRAYMAGRQSQRPPRCRTCSAQKH